MVGGQVGVFTEQWLFSEEALAKAREAAHEHAVQEMRHFSGSGAARDPPKPLAMEEGLSLALFYAQKLLDLCNLCDAPVEVRWTALVFYRRFFVARSAMEYDPVPTMFACVHVACKVEEAHEITLDKLLESGGCGADDGLRAKVAALELPVLEALGFVLLVEPQPRSALRMLAEELRDLLAQGQAPAPPLGEATWDEVVAHAEKITFELSARTDAVLRWAPSILVAGALSTALDARFGKPQCSGTPAPSDLLASLLEGSLVGEHQRSAVRTMVEDVLKCIQRLASEDEVTEATVKDAAKAARRWHRAFERIREEASEQHEAHRKERKRRRGEVKGGPLRQVPTPIGQAACARKGEEPRRSLAAALDGAEDFVIHRRADDMDDDPEVF